jgi:hypothetical protein
VDLSRERNVAILSQSGAMGIMELFNLRNDIHEDRDVAKENPQVVAQIEAYLKTARTESTRWPARTD